MMDSRPPPACDRLHFRFWENLDKLHARIDPYFVRMGDRWRNWRKPYDPVPTTTAEDKKDDGTRVVLVGNRFNPFDGPAMSGNKFSTNCQNMDLRKRR